MIEVRADRRQALALLLVDCIYSRQRGEKTMEERLANEILDAANNTGGAVKRKEDMHKMAEQTKRLHTIVSKSRTLLRLLARQVRHILRIIPKNDQIEEERSWLVENIH